MASCSHPDCCNGMIIKDNGMRFKCDCGGRGDDEIAKLRAEVATLRAERTEMQRDLDAALSGNRQYRHLLDERPEITPQDAMKFNECIARGFSSDASTRVFDALRSHAAKVVPT